MPDFFCTFGFGQPNSPGYVRITAPDHNTARDAMTKKYGRNWCTSYSSLKQVHAFDQLERDHILVATEKKPSNLE